MKHRYLFSITGAATLLLSAVGCTHDFEADNALPAADRIPVELFNSINQVATTRINDEGFCNGDSVGVYVVNYQGGEPGTMLDAGNQADNVCYVYNETDNKWNPEYPVYYYDKVTPVDIIGYYPYGTVDKVNSYAFEVVKDQSAHDANESLGGYEASDFLWGKAGNTLPTATRVNITFHHRMAGVQVDLVEGTGFDDGEWAQIDKAVLVTNTVRKSVINLSTGVVTPTGEAPATGIIPYESGGQFRAVVVPQSVAAQVPLLNITVDGTSYVFRRDEEMNYLSGKLHKFTVEVSKKSASGLEFKLLGESITAWETDNASHDATAREYVVIEVPEASSSSTESALKTAIESAGKDYTKIQHLKVVGEINAADFFFMRDEMPLLQSINLKETKIMAVGNTYKENEIPARAFNEKATLVRFEFPENITKIGNGAFNATNLFGTLIIPNGVVEIDNMAFSSCAALSSYGKHN